MLKISEYVSPGHPDKVADYISQYILDRYIERDPDTRYAVEVQIKDTYVTLGGEVSSKAHFSVADISNFVRKAVAEIGYTDEYQKRWGERNTISANELNVRSIIRQQSPDIAQGLDGWGDQGIFFGYAEPIGWTYGMPKDHTLAKRLCKALFESGLGGLDIKTQIVMDDSHNDRVTKVIVAIPLLSDDTSKVEKFVRTVLEANGVRKGYELIINGTGTYRQHSSIADCGTTGRKLSVDFYGGNCRIGGGSPWTKDASKADLSLNLLARLIAKSFVDDVPVMVSLACCIGKQEVNMCVTDMAGNVIAEDTVDVSPVKLRSALGLDKPIYADMCRWGLFGEYQSDKAWESPQNLYIALNNEDRNS